jgi:hypothetical protein
MYQIVSINAWSEDRQITFCSQYRLIKHDLPDPPSPPLNTLIRVYKRGAARGMAATLLVLVLLLLLLDVGDDDGAEDDATGVEPEDVEAIDGTMLNWRAQCERAASALEMWKHDPVMKQTEKDKPKRIQQ